MIARLKNPLIPTILIILLLTAYFARWEHETSFKPTESAQVEYKKDRWTGQRWITIYTPIKATTKPDTSLRPADDIIFLNKALTCTWIGLFALSVIWLVVTVPLIIKADKNEKQNGV